MRPVCTGLSNIHMRGWLQLESVGAKGLLTPGHSRIIVVQIFLVCIFSSELDCMSQTRPCAEEGPLHALGIKRESPLINTCSSRGSICCFFSNHG